MSTAPNKMLILLVPEAGLEPAQGCPYRILSPSLGSVSLITIGHNVHFPSI
jgi:hypothetical protein